MPWMYTTSTRSSSRRYTIKFKHKVTHSRSQSSTKASRRQMLFSVPGTERRDAVFQLMRDLFATPFHKHRPKIITNNIAPRAKFNWKLCCVFFFCVRVSHFSPIRMSLKYFIRHISGRTSYALKCINDSTRCAHWVAESCMQKRLRFGVPYWYTF